MEDPVCFPPPVVFGLADPRLPVVAVRVGPLGVGAVCTGVSTYRHTVSSYAFCLHILFLAPVFGAVCRTGAGEGVRVGLQGEWVEDLQNLAELNRPAGILVVKTSCIPAAAVRSGLPDEFIDIRVDHVVAEDQQDLLYAGGGGQGGDQLGEILQSVVHLDCHHHCVVPHRTEQLGVPDTLC